MMHQDDIYEDIFEHHPAEMVVVDENGVVTAVNAAKRNIKARKIQVGMRMYVDYATQHIVDMRKELMECIKNGDVRNFDEMPYRDEVLRITIKSLGKNKGAIIVSENISSEVRMRHDLEKREAQLEMIVETAQDAIVFMDCRGCVALWNSSASRIFGYTKSEAIGSLLSDLIIPDESRDECEILLRNFTQTGDGLTFGQCLDKRAMCKNGREIDIQISLSRIETECGWSSAGIIRDVTENKREEDRLRQSERRLRDLSMRDPLTKLYNRLQFDMTLRAEIELARMNEQQLALLICDLDDFKKVNDQFGHQAGDEVIRSFAAIMQSETRSGAHEDVYCRIGGEEFAVIMPFTSIRQAQQIAERIRSAIAAHRFENGVTNASVSIGLAELRSGESHSDFFKRADDLMYNAKKQGKNSVVFEE